jgi:hypothetical protein
MPHPVRPTSAAGIAAVVLALAVSPSAVAQSPAGDRLTCSGALGPDGNQAAVAAAFGKDNVVSEMVDGAEGEKICATVVFPADPARRLEIFWNDDAKLSGVSDVRLSDSSAWIAPNGLKRGMSLAEVEKLNGRPFTLSGFDWDYGGYVTDWKGGALAKPAPGGCVVNVRFMVPAGAPDAAATKVAGDQEFPSTDKNMRAVKPIVGTLGFGYPQP